MMNPSESIRFCELVSKYLDGSLNAQEESELLVFVEHPEYAKNFFDMTRLDGEIKGLLALPVSNETMESAVAKEIGLPQKDSSRLCQAIMSALPERREPRPSGRIASITIAHESRRNVPVERVPNKLNPGTPWLVSLMFHAALIAVFVYFNFITPARKPEETVARAGSLKGETFALAAVREADPVTRKSEVTTTADLVEGQGFETRGKNSTADLSFNDGTSLILGADTRISRLSDGNYNIGEPGKTVNLEQGSLTASIAPQPVGRPMSFITPNARATVIGTKFKLTTELGLTRLEVTEGTVRLTRAFDKASIDVKAGQYSIVQPGTPLEVKPLSAAAEPKFVRGINFYGEAVTIDGNHWQSHNEALAQGLSISWSNLPGNPNVHTTALPLSPPASGDMRAMLNTRTYSYGNDLIVRQSFPNGEYDVYIWVTEASTKYSRLFDVEIGDNVWRGVGRLAMNEWKKYGPYRASVKNGKLEITLQRLIGNPAISGMAIFEVPPGQ